MASIIQYGHSANIHERSAKSAVESYVSTSHMTDSGKLLSVVKTPPVHSRNIARAYVVPSSSSRNDIETNLSALQSKPNSFGKPMLIVAPDSSNASGRASTNASTYSGAGYLVFSDPHCSHQQKKFAANVGHMLPPKSPCCRIL